jgi:hypothetical protein
MKNHQPLSGKIKLIAIFFMNTPKSVPRKERDGWHTKRPDLDNLVKLILDSMNSIVFKDDSQVCAIIAMKGYSEIPRTELTILEDFDDDAEHDDAAGSEDEAVTGGGCSCEHCQDDESDSGHDEAGEGFA